LIFAAASTILSMPGCEHATTTTIPSGVLSASDSSRSSSVPGLSETNAIRWMPGCDLDVLVDELEIGDGPGGAEPHHVGGHAVVVPCSGGSEASLR